MYKIEDSITYVVKSEQKCKLFDRKILITFSLVWKL